VRSMKRRRKTNETSGCLILVVLGIILLSPFWKSLWENQFVIAFVGLLVVIFLSAAVLSTVHMVVGRFIAKQREKKLLVASWLELLKNTQAAKLTRIALLKQNRATKLEEEKRIRALELADVDNMGGIEFEHYASKLLTNREFRVEVTQPSGDLGVDIIAEKDGLKYAIQVKRQTNPVSRRAVSDAVAGKAHYGCNAAMVITNSQFTAGATRLAESTGCELIARNTLSEWVLDFQAPETVIESAEISELDAEIEAESTQLAKIGAELSRLEEGHKGAATTDRYSSSERSGSHLFTVNQWLTLILLGLAVASVFIWLITLVSR
jgi:HJR/Mrr/RecB family endonuclease